MAEEEIYNEALGAIQQGDNRRARDLLARLLKVNPEKVDYWVWMSSVVETKRERIYCLNEALKRDPDNATARRGLVILGAMAPDPGSLPPTGCRTPAPAASRSNRSRKQRPGEPHWRIWFLETSPREHRKGT